MTHRATATAMITSAAIAITGASHASHPKPNNGCP
jgi:hypothetical protein